MSLYPLLPLSLEPSLSCCSTKGFLSFSAQFLSGDHFYLKLQHVALFDWTFTFWWLSHHAMLWDKLLRIGACMFANGWMMVYLLLLSKIGALMISLSTPCCGEIFWEDLALIRQRNVSLFWYVSSCTGLSTFYCKEILP